MYQITTQQAEAAYKLSKEVHAGLLEKQQAKQQLHAQHAMNLTTADHLINNFKGMRNGAKLTRTMSQAIVRVFLSEIRNDYGIDGLSLALSSIEKNIEYYESSAKKKRNAVGMRKLVADYRSKISAEPELAFEEAVLLAMKQPEAQRIAGLNSYGKIPVRSERIVQVFKRNPNVAATVLLRANGMCEQCLKEAPFLRRSTNTPYLEVHHRVRLADDGEDTVENAMAVCPNCHRDLHLGNAVPR